MTRNLSVWTAVVLLAVTSAGFLASCADAATDSNDGAMTVSEFEREYRAFFYRTLCRSSMECPQEQQASITKRVSRYDSLDTCTVGLSTNRVVDISVPFASEVEQGVTRYSAESAQGCLDTLDRLAAENPCDSYLATQPWPEACERVFSGQQSDGMPCSANEHCQSGVCDTTVDVGRDVCWQGECTSDTTVETVGEGEPCGILTRVCDRDGGFECAFSPEEGRNVCVKLSDRTEGASCGQAFGRCADGFACIAGRCTELDFVPEGTSCTPNGTLCEVGTVCVVTELGDDELPESAECRPPRDIDDTCYRHEECVGGTMCSSKPFLGYSKGTCEPASSEGDACTRDLECDLGLECVDEICQKHTPFTRTCDYGG